MKSLPWGLSHALAFALGFGSVVQYGEEKAVFEFTGVLVSLPQRYGFADQSLVYIVSRSKDCLRHPEPVLVRKVGHSTAILLPRNKSTAKLLELVLARNTEMASELPEKHCFLASTRVKYG